MRDIWARVLVAVVIISAITTLLMFDKVSAAAAFTIYGAVAGFFFGQYADKPTNDRSIYGDHGDHNAKDKGKT
jgi:hypothetical protein